MQTSDAEPQTLFDRQLDLARGYGVELAIRILASQLAVALPGGRLLRETRLALERVDGAALMFVVSSIKRSFGRPVLLRWHGGN
jgi:hypothetical protein